MHGRRWVQWRGLMCRLRRVLSQLNAIFENPVHSPLSRKESDTTMAGNISCSSWWEYSSQESEPPRASLPPASSVSVDTGDAHGFASSAYQ